jgi:hypothetical protein
LRLECLGCLEAISVFVAAQVLARVRPQALLAGGNVP